MNTILGYSISMVLLAVVSLAVIPAMVVASGPAAWGMIAAGQSIGGVGAVVVAYGWGLSGPASIARADAQTRLTEYAESVGCKLLIFFPVAILVSSVAWAVGRDYAVFATAGALSTASVGLTANWWFVGRAQPYRLLLFETVPRVAGTGIGILFMVTGSSALVGVLWQLIGMVAAFVACTVWILKPWRLRELRALPRRSAGRVLASQRQGVTSTVLSSVYSSTPIVIVSLVAPGAQPVYAVVEKVQRQVIVGLGPFVTVLQGWVPRAREQELDRRASWGLAAAAACAGALSGLMLAVAPGLVGWLGGGQIHPSFLTLVLMSLITGVSLIESVVSKACLAALRRIDVVTRATAIGSLVGLPLVAVGAAFWGAEGALSGILTGLVLRLVLELLGMRRAIKRRHSEAALDNTMDPEVGVGGS
jgi:O-antigen/teichoic acid export membrane protein